MAAPARRPASLPATRRERRVSEVHGRILQAAMQRFAEQGIDATKIDEICALADVAQKTFFNHFPTKQHIVREIAASFLDDLLAILDEACRAPGTTPQRIERFFMRVAMDVERAGPIHRHLVMEVVRLVHGDRTDVEQSRRLYAAFAALLRDGVRAGDVTSAYPVAVLSEVVVGTFNTLMLNWLGFDDYPFRARATAMARFLTDALRATLPANSELRHPRAGGDPSGGRKPLKELDSRLRGNDRTADHSNCRAKPLRVRKG